MKGPNSTEATGNLPFQTPHHYFPFPSLPPPLPPLVQEYLLQEVDLDGGPGSLRFIEKKNPNHETWGKMKLFLLRQVEERSFAKFGGEEGLDAEIVRRATEKSNQRDKRDAKKMAKVGPLGAFRARGWLPPLTILQRRMGGWANAPAFSAVETKHNDEHVAQDEEQGQGPRARVPQGERGLGEGRMKHAPHSWTPSQLPTTHRNIAKTPTTG